MTPHSREIAEALTSGDAFAKVIVASTPDGVETTAVIVGIEEKAITERALYKMEELAEHIVRTEIGSPQMANNMRDDFTYDGDADEWRWETSVGWSIVMLSAEEVLPA